MNVIYDKSIVHRTHSNVIGRNGIVLGHIKHVGNAIRLCWVAIALSRLTTPLHQVALALCEGAIALYRVALLCDRLQEGDRSHQLCNPYKRVSTARRLFAAPKKLKC
jgi:hypothetical protein